MNWPNGPHIEPIAPTLDLCGPGVCSECGGGCDTSGTCPSCGVAM